MSDGGSGSTPRRPASARPRTDTEHEGMAPPSRTELEAIEQHRLDWAVFEGAEVIDRPDLGLALIRHADPGAEANVAARIRWPADDVEVRLAALDEQMRADDRWPTLIVSSELTEPADLGDRLEAAGWVRVNTLDIMFTRHAPVVPHVDPGLRVEAVTPRTVVESMTLVTEVFGLPEWAIEERAEQLGRALESGAARAFLLRLVHEPVATARLAMGDKVAGLHAVAVGARHRRRGYGKMITAVATRAGLVTGHGLVWLSVDESNVGAIELYRSLGYEYTFSISRWVAPNR